MQSDSRSMFCALPSVCLEVNAMQKIHSTFSASHFRKVQTSSLSLLSLLPFSGSHSPVLFHDDNDFYKYLPGPFLACQPNFGEYFQAIMISGYRFTEVPFKQMPSLRAR